MFKKTFLAAAVAVVTMAGAGSAIAAPVPSIPGGELKFIMDNYDSATTGYGNTTGLKCSTVAECDAAATAKAPGSVGSVNSSADTMGLFSISRITDVTTGNTVFNSGAATGYITGIFGNLADAKVVVSDDGFGANFRTSIASTGGTFQMWFHDAEYNPALGPTVVAGTDLNAGLYPGVSGGTLLLSGVFAAGAVLTGDLVSSYFSSYNNGSFGGNGQGFLDITGGLWASQFDTNSLINANGGKNDLFLTNTYDAVTGAQASIGWTVKSAAQVTGTTVPEPASFGLAALALLSAGFAVYRRRKN